MTIFSTAKDRTENETAGDIHHGVCNVYTTVTTSCRIAIEEVTRVALSCTEEIAGHGMIFDLIQRTRHTDSTAGHSDITGTTYVGHLVTTIDVGKDVSARDSHMRITTYIACLSVPFTGLIRIITGTATKDIAIESMTVGSRNGTAIGIVATLIRKPVIRSKYICLTIARNTGVQAIRPVGTFGHRSGSSYDTIGITIPDSCYCRRPLVIAVFRQ